MSSNGNQSATVETVTAEVRVLMVGSRQVTMSVYNQLDEVSHDRIDAFGRVRPRDEDWRFVHVVGRDRESGALVRSFAWIRHMVREPSAEEVEAANPLMSSIDYRTRAELRKLVRESHRWSSSVIEAAARELARRRMQLSWMTETGEDWEKLPLIVLAGLR
jgi:hypothetical protein